jgi:hypothetical protein
VGLIELLLPLILQLSRLKGNRAFTLGIRLAHFIVRGETVLGLDNALQRIYTMGYNLHDIKLSHHMLVIIGHHFMLGCINADRKRAILAMLIDLGSPLHNLSISSNDKCSPRTFAYFRWSAIKNVGDHHDGF